MVEVAGADVKGEYCMDQGEEQLVDHLPQRWPDSLAVEEALWAMVALPSFTLFHSREVWLQQLLALCGR